MLEVMAENGLKRGEDGLEVYVMCEIPSNVILAEAFAERFDGFSIGSNDLTQLTLGVDRDSEELAGLFDEEDDAVEWMIASVIEAAHKAQRQDRPLRPGAERSSGVRALPGRLRHRLDVGEPRQLLCRQTSRGRGRGRRAGSQTRVRGARYAAARPSGSRLSLSRLGGAPRRQAL